MALTCCRNLQVTAKLTPPRQLDRFAWNFGFVYNSTRAIAWCIFHFRSQSQNRKLPSFGNRKLKTSEPEVEKYLIRKLVGFCNESLPFHFVQLPVSEKTVNFRFWGSDRKWKTTPCNSPVWVVYTQSFMLNDRSLENWPYFQASKSTTEYNAGKITRCNIGKDSRNQNVHSVERKLN